MRKEPQRNVYVGHRYVPLILEEWDNKYEYEGLSVVTHQGGSYTSKKRVPVGIDILNKEFWSLTGNYNAQVDYYRDETERVSQKLDSKSDKTYVDTELGKKSDQTYVDTELGKKANKTYVDTELGKKSDQTYVDTELGKKANKTYVDNELDKKSDQTYVDTELGKKSDQTYVDNNFDSINEKQIDLDIKNSGFINVKSFGVVGDGEVDDTVNMIRAVNEARTKKLSLYASRDLSIKITDTVDFSGIQNIDIQSVIISHVDHKPAIIVGDDSRTTLGHKHYINTVRKGNELNDDDIAIRFQGLKNIDIKVSQSYYVQLYANENNPKISSIAYSTFNLGATDVLELYGETSMSWINENIFYGRFVDIIIGNESSYVHNNNVFYKPSLENGKLDIIAGSRNQFYDVRTEGSTFIKFGERSRKNLFIENFSSSPSRVSPTVEVVEDSGYDNTVTTALEQSLQTVEMVSISNDRLHDGFSLYDFDTPESIIKKDNGFSVPFSFRRIFDKNVKTDSVKRLIFDAETINNESMFRVWVYCLDENQNEINADGNISASGMEYNASENRYQVNSNVNNASILLLSDHVKYLNIVIMAGNNVNELVCNHFSLYTLTNKNNVTKALIERDKFYRNDYFIIKDSDDNAYRLIMENDEITTLLIE